LFVYLHGVMALTCRHSACTYYFVRASSALGVDFGSHEHVADKWARIKEMSPSPIVVDGTSFAPENLSQGELGDCWFVASIAVLASQADACLANIILTREIDPTGAGIYAVRFWTYGHCA
jgi:hypothetical protein